MSESQAQLELLASGAEVPQANNLTLFVGLMEAVDAQESGVEALAEALEVDGRTVRYYANLGSWLGFLRPTAERVWQPTETGATFAESVSARGRLFSQALFSKDIVKLANGIKRQALDAGQALATREACLQAIERTTELSESTARRRSSSLASLIEAAYRPSRVDWETGRMLDERYHPALEFAGESFLTALAMMSLGVEHRMQVGFPRQVHRFVTGEAHKLDAAHWKRASWSAGEKTQWFGGVPINDVTREIALRKGRDLRQLLVVTVPYITLLCACLALRDPLDRPLARMTEDMYGGRLWFHETELGAPRDVLEKLAEALGLEPHDQPPHISGDDDPDACAASDTHLIEVVLAAGICRRRDTVIELAPGVAQEWHDGSDDAPSIEERLEPLRDDIRKILREWS